MRSPSSTRDFLSLSHNIITFIICIYITMIFDCLLQVEQHMLDGKLKTLMMHRKGATRAFPPNHPLIPVDYQLTGTN